MRKLKHLLIGLLCVAFVCGGVGVTTTADSATSITLFGSKDRKKNRKKDRTTENLEEQLDSIKEDLMVIKAYLEDLKEDQTEIQDDQLEILEDQGEIIKLLEVTMPPPSFLCPGGEPGQRWVPTEDGLEVCDATTGIYWQQNPGVNNNGNEVDWFDAKNWCETFARFDLNSNQDYKLPEEEDLYGIFDHEVDGPPTLPSNVFDGIQENARYWTNTESGGSAFSIRIISNTLNGVGGESKTVSANHFGWCVRKDS